MRNIHLAVIGAAFLAGFMLQPAVAEQATGAEFSQLDVDEDGAISLEEAEGSSALVKNWSKADKNKDGNVDVEEFSALEIAVKPDSEGQEAEGARE
jgi:hypothetical protein